MKTIGLVGGTSWLSTIEYYRHFNTITNARLGGDQAARVILYSVNYGEIVSLTHAGDWDGILNIIGDTAKKVEQAGADCLLLGANTMHRIAGEIQSMINIPLIHIAEAVGKEIRAKSLNKVALLGTRTTMMMDFYRNKLKETGVETVLPTGVQVDFVNDAIYQELGKNQFLPATKQKFIDLFDDLTVMGAEGVILGCTEIPILVQQEDTPVPLFDTTYIHAKAAVDFTFS